MQFKIFMVLLVNSFFTTSNQAAVEMSVNPETKLKSWKLNHGVFSLELIQRLPTQTRAFFQGRGFSQKLANDIANSCVLQAIGKNVSGEKLNFSISYDMRDWQVLLPSGSQGIKLKEQWDKSWPNDEVNASARIAFRWATFPTEQIFEPEGDYNWGMISFGLVPGAIFDLEVKWQQSGTALIQRIKRIECPVDQ